MKPSFKKSPFQRGPGGTILGLAFEAGRVEGVLVRRTNGSGEVRMSFKTTLSLDVLTDAPELVGRELRKQLDEAGIRDRQCVVCLPLGWVLTLSTALPDLPPADLDSFVQVEAERGFPYPPETLVMAESRYRTASGTTHATLVAVPRDHVSRLEAVLQAAQLRPVSFSIGIAALQPADATGTDGVLALAPGATSVALQITCGGGLAVLRTLDGTGGDEGEPERVSAEQVARETRVTLGQLPAEVRQSVRRLRVFGSGEAAETLTAQLQPRLSPLGITVEQVQDYPAAEFGLQLPSRPPLTAALALAVRQLMGAPLKLQFLPPRVSAWQRFSARYSSRRIAVVGAVAGGLGAVTALLFLVQQAQIWYWGRQWNGMKARVSELDRIQAQIRRYRPWFDNSIRSLAVLRRLTESFPEDGTVSAKTVEMRDASTITCVGTARDYEALQKTLDRLGNARGVSDVTLEQSHGRSPVEFSVRFRWTEGSGS